MTDTNTQNLGSLSDLEFAISRYSIEYAELTAAVGAKEALRSFNRRVYRWAQSFDTRYRHTAHCHGQSAKAETWAHYRSRRGLAEKSAEIGVKNSIPYGQKNTKDGQTTQAYGKSESALRRQTDFLVAAGILIKLGDRKKDPNSGRTGDASNLYVVDFTKSIQNGEVVEHDFWAPLNDENESAIPGDTPGATPGAIRTKYELSTNVRINYAGVAASREKPKIDPTQFIRCKSCGTHPRNCSAPDRHARVAWIR